MNILIKKTLRDYNYHLETLEDIKNLSSEAETAFRTELQQVDETAIEALRSDNPKPKSEESEPEGISFDDKDFKKLFRKLAVKCHPDKLGADVSDKEIKFLKKCYEDITFANQTYDWGLLLKVALELDVEVSELSEAQLTNINEKVLELKSKIEKYEQSMAYKWYTMPNEHRESYLKECANLFNQFLNKKSSDPDK
jgi:hypothetical protein